MKSWGVLVVLSLVLSLGVVGCAKKKSTHPTAPVPEWTSTTFPSALYGNWYDDGGSWQWGITGTTTIRTWNRFFTVTATYVHTSGEFKVITTESGRWYPFFYKNVTSTNMQANFPGCPSALDGFATESEALNATSASGQWFGNHK